ncbi:hypothetical protein L218DRAFT_947923 [Marasmius fiardii PR-910]|nr:hypothetical protein L218DRAFT_947923 [Marasmius fiardii PR-910]
MLPTSEPNTLKSVEKQQFQLVIVPSLFEIAVHFMLYGLYIPLFHTSLVLLKKRKPSRSRQFHQISLTMLFVLASVSVPLSLSYDVVRVANGYFHGGVDADLLRISFDLENFSLTKKLKPPVGALVILKNIAKIEYLHGVESQPFIPHNILVYLTNAFVRFDGVINFILTSVLAGRRWWLSRKNSCLGANFGERFNQKFNTIVVILLESGVMYLIALVIFCATNVISSIRIGSVGIQIGGITPTLIAVHTNAKKRVSEVEENSTKSF